MAESPGGAVKTQITRPSPESDAVSLGCARSCVSNRFPGAAAAAVWGPHEVWEEASLRERVKKVDLLCLDKKSQSPDLIRIFSD